MPNEKISLPLDPIGGAELVIRIAHGLLTGPGAVSFMRQTALGPGAELMVDQLMQTAEKMAQAALLAGTRLRVEVSREDLKDVLRQVTK